MTSTLASLPEAVNGKTAGGSAVKVLYLISFLKKMGGAEKNFVTLVHQMDRRRFEPIVAVLQGGDLVEDLRRDGLTVLDFSLQKICSLEGLRKGLQLARFIRRQGIRLVVTYHHDADLWGAPFARLGGAAVVSSRRDMGYQLERKHVWAYRLINHLFTRVIAVSDAVGGIVRRREWLPARKIVTVRNGVDTTPYEGALDAPDKKRSLGLDPSRQIVGMVASLRPVKGQEFFVRAAALVLKKRPRTQFVLVGRCDSSYFRLVQGLIGDLGLADAVFCLGARDDVAEILRVLDVFVMSSLQEGFSNAIIEAMAAGVPVVASSGGGNPEAVQEGVTGLLTPPGEVDGLAQKIERLLEDESLRRRLAENAREAVRQRFSKQAMIDATTEVFESVLAGRAGGAS